NNNNNNNNNKLNVYISENVPETSEKEKKESRNIMQHAPRIPILNVNNGNTDHVRICGWIDSYAKKYGVGYLLSNKCMGVYFNDSSKIVMCPDKQTVFYIDNICTGKDEEQQRSSIQEMSIGNYPSHLAKKMTLLLHFDNYLRQKCENEKENKEEEREKEKENENENEKKEEEVGGGKFERDEIVFVRKYVKTKYAISFRLNNKTVHTIFMDKTQVVVFTNSQTIVYIDKHQNKQSMSLCQAFNSQSKDLQKRMKYTQKLIEKGFRSR
ncbi:hypothetical protein RFI_30572, partial [Reticulomyxa filosa]